MRLGDAVDAYLADVAEGGEWNTSRAYRHTLGQLRDGFGDAVVLGEISAEDFAAWFTRRWDGSAPASWNTSLLRIRRAARWWHQQGWLEYDFTGLPMRRQAPAGRSVLTGAEVARLLGGQVEGTGLRDQVLWRILHESGARARDVLALDIGDLDMDGRRAIAGGQQIRWHAHTGQLLARYLEGRTAGAVFLSESRGQGRLSYTQAAAIFSKASGGRTLHQWRQLRRRLTGGQGDEHT